MISFFLVFHMKNIASQSKRQQSFFSDYKIIIIVPVIVVIIAELIFVSYMPIEVAQKV